MRGKITIFAAALAALALGLLSSCQSARNATPAGLFGMVYDKAGEPVRGASIQVDDREAVLTDSNGRFVVPDVARGPHTVRATLDGYEPLEREFLLASDTDVLYLKMSSLDQLLADAESAMGLNKWQDARASVDRALAVENENALGLFMLGLLALRDPAQADDAAEAAGRLEALLAKGFEEAYIHALLADLYERRLGDPAKALAHLKRLAVLAPDPATMERIKGLEGGEQ